MFCRQCRQELMPNAAVCVKCGVPTGQGTNFCPNCGSLTSPAAAVCVKCGIQLPNSHPNYSDKEWMTALLLSIFLGHFGIDRFYLGYTTLGIVKLLTFGGCGVWTLIDIILIAMNNMPYADGRPLKK